MDSFSNLNKPNRERIVTWVDPQPTLSKAASMNGFDYLNAMAQGELPLSPIGRLMGFESGSVGEGTFTLHATPGEHHFNPVGIVHGGFASTILDSVMGCSIHTLLPAGAFYSTLELKINFVRAITLDTGPMLCEGKVIHNGRRIATAEGRLTDQAGKLYAHGSTTCMIQLPER